MVNILKKRKEFEISQEYLSEIMGISRPTLIKVEKGKRKLKKEEEQKAKEFFDSLSFERQEENLKISLVKEDEEKFRQVFLYILEKVGAKPNVGMTVLYKLLYFIDFDYYEKYQKQLIGLTYFKNTHGPTPRNFKKIVDKMKKDKEVVEIKSKFFKNEQIKFLPNKKSDLSLLNGQELEMIDSVLEKYSDKTASEISEISHRDMPWKVAKMKEDIKYDHVFYRSEEFAVGEYDEL